MRQLRFEWGQSMACVKIGVAFPAKDGTRLLAA